MSKLKKFIDEHRWSTILVTASFFVSLFILWDSFSANGLPFSIEEQKIPKKEVLVRAPFSGRMVPPSEAKKMPAAIVVENHPDARPQSGLGDAAVVIETFAEGGITRFLAFFQDREPKEIGPVRSAREYFVEWADAYGALFAHVGGNYDALTLISKLGVYDLNQFSLGSSFWRDQSRYAPHNVYTTYQKLTAAADTKKYPKEYDQASLFNFKKDLKNDERPVGSYFDVLFNSLYSVRWTYDPIDNSYLRSMLGSSFNDRVTGEQIRAKNVIVCFSDFSNSRSAIGEQKVNIRTTGSGSALFFLDGQKVTGTWRRDLGKPIKLYTSDGGELEINAGVTWIQVAPQGTQVR